MSQTQRPDSELPNDDTDLLSKPESKTQKPAMYKVILLNDDFTPMEFVVHVIVKFFNKTETEAVHLMLSVHNHGKAVVGIYTRSIAETKVRQVNDYSKQYEFPLLCTFEKE